MASSLSLAPTSLADRCFFDLPETHWHETEHDAPRIGERAEAAQACSRNGAMQPGAHDRSPGAVG